MRGLDALCFLNARRGATVADVVAAVGLPRTTVYRLLETLRLAGYVERGAGDDRYRVTHFVRGLADSLDESARIAALAAPYLAAAGRALDRPVAIATPAGATMCSWEPAPNHQPLLQCASGIAYLAACAPAVRTASVEAALRAARRTARATPAPAMLAERLAAAAAAGYAALPGEPGANPASLALALAPRGAPIAALSLRFNSATLPAPLDLRRFLAELQTCAARIGEEFAGGPKE